MDYRPVLMCTLEKKKWSLSKGKQKDAKVYNIITRLKVILLVSWILSIGQFFFQTIFSPLTHYSCLFHNTFITFPIHLVHFFFRINSLQRGSIEDLHRGIVWNPFFVSKDLDEYFPCHNRNDSHSRCFTLAWIFKEFKDESDKRLCSESTCYVFKIFLSHKSSCNLFIKCLCCYMRAYKRPSRNRFSPYFSA